MPKAILNSVAIAVVCCGLSGCCLIGPRAHHGKLAASQLRSQELFAENEQLMLAQQNAQQTIGALEQERQMLSQQLVQTESQLGTANTRLDNLLVERGEIKDRYANLLKDATSDPIIAGGPMTAQVPGFKYDELTGLNKFPEDIHFDLGSAELRSESYPVIKEFANQILSGSNEGMRVLVVGHTDDQPITRGSTNVKHPTNWHLSTDRSDQVIMELERLGVPPERIAAMGYSKYQPLGTTTDEPTRQRNRRVELYIVPQTSNVAAWDPVRSLN
ncbi:MAG: OmpA family protein [Fuerstiella sp.]